MTGETILNMDPHMAVSLVNMKLRDFYSSLDNYCDDLDLNKEELIDHLAKAGYEYNNELNQFK